MFNRKFRWNSRLNKKALMYQGTFLVTVQQVCALAALTVRKHRLEDKNPISEADLEWIFARNYEGTE